MKKIILLLFAFHLIISAQTEKLTLEKSLEIGLKNSKELQIANSKILKAGAIESEIGSSMLPKISFNAVYRRLSDVHPFQLNLPVFPQPVTIQETILDNYSLSASVEQPLFTGFKLSSLKSAAALNKKAEKVLYENEEIKKAEEIKKIFWRVYNLQMAVALLKENLNSLKHHLKDTENFLENGLVTKNDYLKLKVEISNIKLKLLEAENNNHLAKTMFNKVLGFALNKKTEIVVDSISSDTLNYDYPKLLGKALKNRKELKATELRMQAMDEKKTAAKSDWFPQLFAFGNYYYTRPNQRYLPLKDEFNDSWDVGVALKWNIWNWGGTSAKVQQAEEDYFQLEKKFELLKEAVELDVYNNYSKLKTSVEKINLAKLQIESAKENYRITKAKYNQQLVTSTELIDAEAALLNAKTKLLTSKVEYELSKLALWKAVGEINKVKNVN